MKRAMWYLGSSSLVLAKISILTRKNTAAVAEMLKTNLSPAATVYQIIRLFTDILLKHNS